MMKQKQKHQSDPGKNQEFFQNQALSPLFTFYLTSLFILLSLFIICIPTTSAETPTTTLTYVFEKPVEKTEEVRVATTTLPILTQEWNSDKTQLILTLPGESQVSRLNLVSPEANVVDILLDGRSVSFSRQELKKELAEQSSKQFFWIIGFIGSLVLFLFVFLEVERSRDRKLGSDREQRDEHLELTNYIMMNIDRGYTAGEIRKSLLSEGWPASLVDKSLQPYQGVNIARGQLLQLRTYIRENLNKGFSEKQLRNELKKGGWSDPEIDLGFAS